MAQVLKCGEVGFLYIFVLIHCMVLFQVPSMNCQTSELVFPPDMWPFCVDNKPHFRPQQIIKIAGFFQNTARAPWLDISLRPQCFNRNNSPFYLKIRFSNRKVIRTSVQDGIWATEESDAPFNFTLGTKFLLLIELLPTGYKVTANGVPLGTYRDSCSSCSSSQSLKVEGASASIQRVDLIDKTKEGQPGRTKILYPVPLGPNVLQHPSFPFWGYFPEKLQAGKAIHITGFFPHNAKRTTIDLRTACFKCPIMLHMDVRFRFGDSVKKVTRNIYVNGDWGNYEYEEGSGPFPFHLAEPFSMTIAVQPDAYYIEVDGSHCWTFKHRLPFTDVNAMTITRDHMSIWSVQYTDIAGENTTEGPTTAEIVAPGEIIASNDCGINLASFYIILSISLISSLQLM